MATLLDSLNSRLAQMGTIGGTSSLAQQLLRAKTGRVVGVPSEISQVGEQVAAAEEARVRDEELAPQLQAQRQAGQLEEKELAVREREATAGAAQKRRFDTLNNQMQLAGTLGQLERERDQLSFEQKRAGMEQASFNLAMQDKKYTDDLLRTGQLRRLTEKANFLSEMQDLVFGDSLAVLQEQVGRENILSMSRAAFATQISNMNIENAVKLAELEAQAREKEAATSREGLQFGMSQAAQSANLAAQYGGLSQLVSAGISGYGKYEEKQAEAARQKRLEDLIASRGT